MAPSWSGEEGRAVVTGRMLWAAAPFVKAVQKQAPEPLSLSPSPGIGTSCQRVSSGRGCCGSALRLASGSTLALMRALAGFLLVLLLIGGGLKLMGMRLPILDYSLGGPMAQPQIKIVQPDLHLP